MRHRETARGALWGSLGEITMKMTKARALLLSVALAACSQGADIASPGATGGGGTGGTGGGGGGGSGSGATCPAGTALGSAVGALTVCNITGEILSNLTLPFVTGVVYRLNGRVDVGRDVGGDGALPGGISATLTIEPGVRVFGGASNDMLVINRGSQIQAVGAPTNPIQFTSQSAILAQQQSVPTTEFTRQWAGVVIAGRAPTRQCATAVPAESVNCQNEVEGITASTGRPARYGGATPADNSGNLQYVQIKFGGAFLPGAAAGDDLNGLTLAGVGSGTNIQYVQIHNNGDDGIEIFGGRVNLKNYIITGAFDDSLDCDAGWTGVAQFGIIIQRLYSVTGGPDSLVECSNHPGVSSPSTIGQTRPIIANFTFIGQPLNGGGGSIRGVAFDQSGGGAPGSSGRLFNGIVTGSTRCLSVSTADNSAGRGAGDFATITANSVLFDCPGAYSAEASGIIAAGTNNSTAVAKTLQLALAPRVANTTQFDTRFVNGATETARTHFDLTTLGNPALTPTTYIGAVRDTSDNWWRGWSCGLETANC